ncbi:MAG: cupin domain-containing protein [Rhodanobacteraceae bacterium]
MHPIINIADLDPVSRSAMSAKGGVSEPPDRFGGSIAQIGRKIGAKHLGYNLTLVPPGKRAFPFHSHRVNEEMFFVLEGRGEIRIGDASHVIRAGDVIACPPGGPESAHQIVNTSDADLRYLAVSTAMASEVCEYPDSQKFGVWVDAGPDAKGFRLIGRGAESLDYWDGE